MRSENIIDLIERWSVHKNCPDKCFRCKYEREKIIQKYRNLYLLVPTQDKEN